MFLPGVGEIARVAAQSGTLLDVEVLQVHGRAPAAVHKDAAPMPGRRRRVVLATSVAESSLTVPVLRQRLAFVHRQAGEPWPDVSDDALHARVREWLEPELSLGARRRADLALIDAGRPSCWLLPWASGEAARLDELAPERITVPSGSAVRSDHPHPARPVLAVKLQEMFGLQESPRVAGVPLLVHLLSPAGRPAAVTADLASF
ncbi:hypothetical protein SHIRM173S_05772 [Streptomyces hirsutus]